MRTTLMHRGLRLGLLVAILTAGNAMAEIVMRVDGVDGETCFTPNHDKWICVVATSSGAANPCTILSGGAGCAPGAGRPSFSELTATILQTSASPQLLAKLLTGSPINSVEIEWWEQSGADKVRTARLLLEGVFLTSFSSSAGDDRPVDNVSFVFSKMTSTVWARTSTGIGVPTMTCWDVIENRVCQ